MYFYYILSPTDPCLPEIVIAQLKLKPRDQADAVWSIMGFNDNMQCLFILVSIVLYLCFKVNLKGKNFVLYRYNTPELVAGEGFEPPSSGL
jgi:hypothetical protein